MVPPFKDAGIPAALLAQVVREAVNNDGVDLAIKYVSRRLLSAYKRFVVPEYRPRSDVSWITPPSPTVKMSVLSYCWL